LAERKASLKEKRVFSTGEAAKVCGLSLQTIIRCFDTGKLRGFRVPGSRFRRIPRDSLVDFMRSNNIPLDSLLTVKKRILIVDDDEDLSNMLREYLEIVGSYDIRQASTGFDAGVFTQKFRPDLILLDVMLPDLNGREVCRAIKSNPDTARTKIIVMSGMIEKDKIGELYEVGADEYLGKPFELEFLSERIQAHLSLS